MLLFKGWFLFFLILMSTLVFADDQRLLTLERSAKEDPQNIEKQERFVDYALSIGVFNENVRKSFSKIKWHYRNDPQKILPYRKAFYWELERQLLATANSDVSYGWSSAGASKQIRGEGDPWFSDVFERRGLELRNPKEIRILRVYGEFAQEFIIRERLGNLPKKMEEWGIDLILLPEKKNVAQGEESGELDLYRGFYRTPNVKGIQSAICAVDDYTFRFDPQPSFSEMESTEFLRHVLSRPRELAGMTVLQDYNERFENWIKYNGEAKETGYAQLMLALDLYDAVGKILPEIKNDTFEERDLVHEDAVQLRENIRTILNREGITDAALTNFEIKFYAYREMKKAEESRKAALKKLRDIPEAKKQTLHLSEPINSQIDPATLEAKNREMKDIRHSTGEREGEKRGREHRDVRGGGAR